MALLPVKGLISHKNDYMCAIMRKTNFLTSGFLMDQQQMRPSLSSLALKVPYPTARISYTGKSVHLVLYIEEYCQEFPDNNTHSYKQVIFPEFSLSMLCVPIRRLYLLLTIQIKVGNFC